MRVTLRVSSDKRAELWSGAADPAQKYLVPRTDCLVDSVGIGGTLYVGRELASKVGDQHYDLALGVVGGGRWELRNLRFCLLHQIPQLIREFWQPRVGDDELRRYRHHHFPPTDA